MNGSDAADPSNLVHSAVALDPTVATGSTRKAPVEEPPSGDVLGNYRAGVFSWLASPHESGGTGGGPRFPTAATPEGLFDERELDAIETAHPQGLTVAQVVELFAQRKIRMSEATFRKYVQQGLLPRSRRVGRKGKHRGSLGMYPARVVRRINTIKALMGDGYTIEEIQERYLRFTELFDSATDALGDLSSELRDAGRADNDPALAQEISLADELARRALAELERIAKRLAQPQSDRFESADAANTAEDLL